MKHTILKIMGVLVTLVAVFGFSLPAFAASLHPGTTQCPYYLSGSNSSTGAANGLCGSNISTSPNELISTIINIMFAVVGLIFFVMIVIAGIQWVTSGGEEEGKKAAQGRLINAVIGIAIVAAAYLVVELVSNLLGISSIFNSKIVNCTAGQTGTCNLSGTTQ